MDGPQCRSRQEALVPVRAVSTGGLYVRFEKNAPVPPSSVCSLNAPFFRLKWSGDVSESPKKQKARHEKLRMGSSGCRNAVSRLVSEPHRLRFAGDQKNIYSAAWSVYQFSAPPPTALSMASPGMPTDAIP